MSKSPRFFYGYTIVGASFLSQMLMLGAFFSFGIFFKPLASDMQWSRALTSGAYSLGVLMFGLLSIPAGRLTDRYGPRVVLSVCGAATGLGLILMSQVNSVWQFYLLYSLLIGAGVSGVDVPVLATIARWFVKRRGIAMGVTKVGAGTGLMVMPIFANWLISHYSWRLAYGVFGAMVLVGVVILASFLRRDPAQMGQLPNGAKQLETAKVNIDFPRTSVSEIIGTSRFWLYSAVWFSFTFNSGMLVAHLAPHVSDTGLSASVAASVAGAMGGFSILGRLGMGGVCDRFGVRRAFFVGLGFLTVSLLWLQFARGLGMFYFMALLYGIAQGSFFTLFTPMAADLFGLASLGAITGIVFAIGNVAMALGPFLAGRIFDVVGSYQIAFEIGLILSIAALVLMVFLTRIVGRTASKCPKLD